MKKVYCVCASLSHEFYDRVLAVFQNKADADSAVQKLEARGFFGQRYGREVDLSVELPSWADEALDSDDKSVYADEVYVLEKDLL